MANSSGSASLDNAMKAISAGERDGGVFWLKTWLRENPANSADLRAAATEAAASQTWRTAAILLQALAQVEPSAQNRLDLAKAALRSGDKTTAATAAKSLLDAGDAPPALRADASVICAEAGDIQAALTEFRALAAAAQVTALYALSLSDAVWTTDPAAAEETIAAGLKLLNKPEDADARTWSNALRLMEWRERNRRGLSIANADSAAEVDFTVARPFAAALLAQTKPLGVDPRNDTRAWTFAMAAGELAFAGTALRMAARAAKGNATEPSVHLNPGFLDGAKNWDSAPFLGALAPVQTIVDAAPQPDTFLLPCDRGYFELFCLPLLRSMAAVSPGTSVHVHLFAEGADEIGQVTGLAGAVTPLHLKVTAEIAGSGRYFSAGADNKSYYHAARFLRFHQFLEQAGGALWMMDVDALVNRDVAEAFAFLGSKDIGLRVRPARTDPWNRFSACLVAARNTPPAKTYARMTACYLARIMERNELRWGADQAALYSAFLAMGPDTPATAFWPQRIADTTPGAESVFWFTAGSAKQIHLTNTGAPTSPYEAAFRTYSTR